MLEMFLRSISIQGIPAPKASEIPLRNRKDIKLNKIQVSQTVSASPGFWIAQRFFHKGTVLLC